MNDDATYDIDIGLVCGMRVGAWGHAYSSAGCHVEGYERLPQLEQRI